jgi:hypothetical protein
VLTFEIDSFVPPWLDCGDNSALVVTNESFRWQSH